MLAASPARKTRTAPPATAEISDEVKAKLALLEPLPVEGPDSAVVQAHNRFLAACRDYIVDAESNPDADVSIPDELAWAVVRTPACTPAGALLKIHAASSHMAGGEVLGEFPFDGKDFQFDPDFNLVDQIEYQLIPLLRDDLRRMQAPPLAVGSVSPDLAAMLAIWRQRDVDEAARVRSAQTENLDTVDKSERVYAMQVATHARAAIEAAIAYQPARSFADIMAKFETVREYAELEDHNARMQAETGVERMLWSICGDLERLKAPDASGDAGGTSDCRVAVIADQFRKATVLFDAVDGDDRPVGQFSKASKLRTLTDRSEFLKLAASHERATSVKGALFQIAIVASLVDMALHSTEWRETLANVEPGQAFNLPETVRERELQIYRLLQSGVTAIARACGLPSEEYCGDQFLNVDPFEYMGA